MDDKSEYIPEEISTAVSEVVNDIDTGKINLCKNFLETVRQRISKLKEMGASEEQIQLVVDAREKAMEGLAKVIEALHGPDPEPLSFNAFGTHID